MEHREAILVCAADGLEVMPGLLWIQMFEDKGMEKGKVCVIFQSDLSL